MEWIYFSMAALWALGCASASALICVRLRRKKGWRFLSVALPLLIPIAFLLGGIPLFALRESYSQTVETLRADEWTCTEGRLEAGQTVAAHTSQSTERFVCTRYERIRK